MTVQAPAVTKTVHCLHMALQRHQTPIVRVNTGGYAWVVYLYAWSCYVVCGGTVWRGGGAGLGVQCRRAPSRCCRCVYVDGVVVCLRSCGCVGGACVP